MTTRTLTPFKPFTLAGIILLVMYVAVNGWVSDDSYYAFRVVDNAINGYGLRWNVNERVQAFTAPLWVLVHIPLVYLFSNVFLVTLAVSTLCTLLTLILCVRLFPATTAARVFVFIIPLMLSKSFIDFSTSGLENPLSCLLFMLFTHTLMAENRGKPFWFYVALGFALLGLNRLDTLLLALPAFLMLFFSRGGVSNLHRIIAGLLPLAGWLGFACFYYGTPFPNARYAKLSTGLAQAEYTQQGWVYVQNLWANDAASCVLLLLGSIATLVNILRGLIELRYYRPYYRQLASLGVGVWLYLAYIIYIGGDFMGGRFFMVPVFASAMLLLASLPKRGSATLPFLLGVCVSGAFLFQHFVKPPVNYWHDERALPGGIADERHWYIYVLTALKADYSFRGSVEDSWWAQEGTNYRQNETPFVAGTSNGILGYYAGPRTVILDLHGLADALLSRLPARQDGTWRIGHFERVVPQGYEQALLQGDTSAMPEGLREYTTVLRTIVSAPLLDKQRIAYLPKFLKGDYDYLIFGYMNSTPPEARFVDGAE